MHSDEVGYLHNAISLLEKTPKLLETLLAGVSDETMAWKPAPDRWSIAEVLAHLGEIEKIYNRRAERIVGEESPLIEKYDQVSAAAAGYYSRGRGDDNLVAFAEARAGAVAFLSMLPPSAGERTGRHSELGRVTLSEMLHEWASHDLGHLRQIAELYRAREFYPYSGAFQKYSSPKP